MPFGSWKRWVQSALVLLAPLLAPQLGNAAPLGVLTIADGEVSVLRDALRFAATEGVRLQADDIVRTADKTRLARIEFDDGTAVDLGPATQALLRPRAAATADRAPVIYLLQGWAKVSVPAAPSVRSGVGAADRGRARRRACRVSCRQGGGVGVRRIGRRGRAAAPRPGQRARADARRGRFVRGARRRAGPGQPPCAGRPDGETCRARWPTRCHAAPRNSRRAGGADWMRRRRLRRRWRRGSTASAALRAVIRRALRRAGHAAGVPQALVAEMALHPEWQRVVFPPEPPRPRVVVAQRAPPVLPPPAARPASADTQWRIRIDPPAEDAPAPDAAVAAARAEPAPSTTPRPPNRPPVETRHEAAAQVQPRLPRRLPARPAGHQRHHAQTARAQRPGRGAAARALPAREGAGGALVHLDPGRAAARDADEVRLPAAVGAGVLGHRGAGQAAEEPPRVRLQGGDAEPDQPARPRGRVGGRRHQRVPQVAAS